MKKLLYMLLALLGISATGCDFGRVEYGVPHVHFNLKARVVDEAGKPIEGIDEKSNVLQWITEDGTKVSVRPSGTEPKIKFYFGVKATLPSVDQFDEVQAALDAKFEAIKAELNL